MSLPPEEVVRRAAAVECLVEEMLEEAAHDLTYWQDLTASRVFYQARRIAAVIDPEVDRSPIWDWENFQLWLGWEK